MTRTPTIHYCPQREVFITLDQTMRSCIGVNQCYSDEPCPHAQNFQTHSTEALNAGGATMPGSTPISIPYPAE